MPPLEPAAARPVGAMLFLLLGAVQFLLVPDGFAHAPYVGVCLIIAILMSFGGAAGFLADTPNRVWGYALGEGVANALGVICTTAWGIPLVDPDTGSWVRWTHPLLLLGGVTLAGLASWALWSQRHGRRARPTVISAAERRYRPPRRPRSPVG
ncbi:hypothetical protein [Actinomadura gamaensis]|uniref:MFS transporter n=1 Tax=Actinomadura gamaensis TaxID=1763541 RepID=A0ABV9U267_9ACTN